MITEIWYLNRYINIKEEDNLANMRKVTSFGKANNLKPLVKLQGGYYFLNDKLEFEYLGKTLYLISFRDYCK